MHVFPIATACTTWNPCLTRCPGGNDRKASSKQGILLSRTAALIKSRHYVLRCCWIDLFLKYKTWKSCLLTDKLLVHTIDVFEASTSLSFWSWCRSRKTQISLSQLSRKHDWREVGNSSMINMAAWQCGNLSLSQFIERKWLLEN